MKKNLIPVLMMISCSAFAQGMYGFAYSVSIPLGISTDYINNTSFRGFEFEGRYLITEKFSGGFTTGWKVFYDEVEGSFTNNTQIFTGKQYRYINVFPALLTFDYYFEGKSALQPYGGLGIGTFWIEQKTNMGLYSGKADNWHLGFAPELGVILPLGIRSDIYASVKYNLALKTGESIDYSFIGLNIGFIWE